MFPLTINVCVDFPKTARKRSEAAVDGDLVRCESRSESSNEATMAITLFSDSVDSELAE